MDAPADAPTEHRESLPAGLAGRLLQHRHRLHRERCQEAANRAVHLLGEMGIGARIFGALASDGEHFPADGGVDLCILDQDPLHGPAGPRYGDIMLAVGMAAEGLEARPELRVHFLSQLSPVLAALVRDNGRSRVG